MPNNGDTSNYTSVFRLTPLGDPHRKVIKRNRQVVSCVPCRTRKLKCDRQQPCTSCVKRSDAVSCRFFGASGVASVGGHSPSVPRKQMQIRLQQLEDLVNGMITESGDSAAKDTSGATPSTEGPQLAVSTSSRDEAVSPGQSSAQERLGSEGNSVRYAGGTSYAAVLECIHNLQEIVDEEAPDYLSASSQHLSRPGSQHEAREGQQQQEPLSTQSYESAGPLTAQQIMDCLPSRTECDKILTFFFQQVCMYELSFLSRTRPPPGELCRTLSIGLCSSLLTNCRHHPDGYTLWPVSASIRSILERTQQYKPAMDKHPLLCVINRCVSTSLESCRL